jgi:hypothetical protein
MFSKAKVALSAAIVLGTTFPAWARESGDCSPFHPPFCSNICTGSARCAPLRNYRLGRHHVKLRGAAKPHGAKSSQ